MTIEPKKFTVPGAGLLDPARLRAEQIAKEAKDRFKRIRDRIMDIMIEEKVKVIELSVIVSMLTGKINHEWDDALIEDVLKLNK